MKIIINESRLEKLVLNYIKKQLGEYHPNDDKNITWDGLFYKGGEAVAGIFNSNLYILNKVDYEISTMFDLNWTIIYKLMRMASEDLSGIEIDRIINIEKIYLE